MLLAATWLFTVPGDDPAPSRAVVPVPTPGAPADEATSTAPPPSGESEVPRAPPALAPSFPAPTTPPDDLTFTDISNSAGLAEPHGRGTGPGATMAAGAAVGDIDDDGDLDIYLTRVGLPNRLLENDGAGSYRDITEEAKASIPQDGEGGSTAAVFADIDGDRDLDLIVVGYGTSRMQLYRNDGSGAFEEDAAGASLTVDGETRLPPGFGVALADVDGDDDLDLITTHWHVGPFGAQVATGSLSMRSIDQLNDEGPSMCEAATQRAEEPITDAGASFTRLWLNDGSGGFRDVTSTSGLDVESVVAFQPTFADVDGDRWPDLFLTGDFCTSRLYRNDRDGTFTDVTADAGVSTEENGMGSVVEDIDRDGHLDWLVTSIAYPTAQGGCPISAPSVGCSGNRLYLGDGRGGFRDATDEYGVGDSGWGWGASGADLDHDGNRDLLTVAGHQEESLVGMTVDNEPNLLLYEHIDGGPIRLWLGGSSTPLPEAAHAVGLESEANTKALVAFDADGDGDLDLLLANTGAPPVLFRNDLVADADRNWITLRLRDPSNANPYAIGAQVRADLGDGLVPLLADVRAGGTFQSGDPTDIHLGLGAATSVERLEILWPGSSEPQVLENLEAGQIHTIERG